MSLFLLAAEKVENGLWFPHDPWEMFYGSLAFLVVAVLLWKFARKPGSDALKKRTERIESTLAEATTARESAEAERDRIKAALADSDAEGARIIEDARQAADALAVEIAARGERDMAAVRERATIDLAATRGQVQADLSGELSRLALGAAEKVVEGTLDDANQQRLIDAYINQVGTQN